MSPVSVNRDDYVRTIIGVHRKGGIGSECTTQQSELGPTRSRQRMVIDDNARIDAVEARIHGALRRVRVVGNDAGNLGGLS